MRLLRLPCLPLLSSHLVSRVASRIQLQLLRRSVLKSSLIELRLSTLSPPPPPLLLPLISRYEYLSLEHQSSHLMISSHSAALAAVLFGIATASPAPTAHAIPHVTLQAPIPDVTPFMVEHHPTKTLQARADILSKITGGVGSVLSSLGSAIPSYVASGKQKVVGLRH